MSRKVHAEVELTVLVPVRVKASVIVRIEEDASFAEEVTKLLQGTETSEADLEGIDLEEVLDVNGCNEEDFETAIVEALECPGDPVVDHLTGKTTRIHSISVTESK